MVRQTTELEVNMNSVERLMEYDAQPPEAADVVPARRPLPGWPHHGAISVEQLVVSYRPELGPVLHGITFAVAPREKVGVAGRTGCGKSTLMMALCRIVEPQSGRVVIDGIDTSTIGLLDLRSRLALVPQDPVLFSGSVRSNLDPFGAAAGGDAGLWSALERAGVAPAVRAMPGGLDADVAEGGGNLSAGQRQLLCMARALLRAARVLILDEATSSIDNATDAGVQATVAAAFADCTVLTIAHRLHTIVGSDRVLVLDGGRVQEFDAPAALLRKQGGAFRALVEETARHHGAQ
jgi:ABC-type multidrug transport system fused ATPase/permease subunit